MRFLVVDDSVTMRRIIQDSLQRIGYTDCVQAGSGAEALDRFGPDVDFVITDWNMPEMDGLDLVRRLRARDDGRTVPVLMVTVRTVQDDLDTAMQAGVNDILPKPFTPQGLEERIHHVLAAASGDA